MDPQVSVGVLSQKLFRAVGVGDPLDDCWALADIMAALASASWVTIPDVATYRVAAGNPDEIGVSDGGTLAESVKAVTKLWPKLAELVEVRKPGELTASAVVARCVGGHPTSGSVQSSALPARLQFGFGGRHRCAWCFVEGKLLIANPLDAPFHEWREITEDELKAAIRAYPSTAGGGYLIFPTVEQAFRTHPLLEGEIARALTAAVEAAASDAINDLKVLKDRVAAFASEVTGSVATFAADVADA